jgi:alkaline phosphatase
VRKTIFAVVLAVFAVQCLIFAADTPETRRDSYTGPAPKYIFYFIGDGFGAPQAEAAETYLAAKAGRIGVDLLAMDTMPVYGMATTFADKALITDSGAAGTALSTGDKTLRGRIGTAPDNARVETIAERAHKLGMKVGIVTSVPVDHATPAVFYAHQPNRDMYYEISLDLSASGFEYFAGSGFSFPDGDPKVAAGDKSFNIGQGGAVGTQKERNSMDLARERGYVIAEGHEAVAGLKKGGKSVATAGTCRGAGLKYAIDRTQDDLTLSDFTAKGIELLDGQNGFFMMVEGGQIDWACHANDAATTICEVLDFDTAIKLALAFYEKHPGETLIVVTSDHETGGMALGNNAMQYESNLALLANQKISYAAFPQIVKQCAAIHPEGGDAALDLAREYFGLGDAGEGLELNSDEKAALETAFVDGQKNQTCMNADERKRIKALYDRYDPFAMACCRILDEKAGIGWTSHAHTASPVPVRAIGCGSALFGGYIDNTDIAKNVFRLLEIRQAVQNAK